MRSLKFPRRTLLICAGLMCFLAIGSAIWSRWETSKRVARIQTKLQLLRRSGYPTSGTEVPAGPPTKLNAYLEIAPHVVRNSSIVAPKSPTLNPIKPDVFRRKEDQAYLEKQLFSERVVVQLIEKAFRTKPAYFVPRRRDLGIMELFPDLPAAKLLARVFLGQLRLAVRKGDLATARERLRWIHRVEQSYFDDATMLSWLTAQSLMQFESGELLALHCEGEPVSTLLVETAQAWEQFNISEPKLLGYEALNALVLCRQCDTQAIQRTGVELELRKRLKINEPSSVYDFARAETIYIPRYKQTQVMMEATLDEWLKADGDKPNVKKIDVVRKAAEIFDLTIMAGPPAVRLGGFEPRSSREVEMTAKTLLKPRLYPQLLRALMDNLNFKRRRGYWRPKSILKLHLESLGFEEQFVFEVKNGVASVQSVGTNKRENSSRPWISLEYPPRFARSDYIWDTKIRRDEIRRLDTPR